MSPIRLLVSPSCSNRATQRATGLISSALALAAFGVAVGGKRKKNPEPEVIEIDSDEDSSAREQCEQSGIQLRGRV